jgi:hypothetical protein
MAREQFDQPVVEAFERELRDALAIEPSPEFARQVRARIAARRSPPVRWTYGLAAAAVCVLALGLGWWLRPGDVTPDRVQQSRHRDVHLNPEIRVTAAVAPVEPSGETSSAPRVSVRPKPETIAEPEVIVPPDRALALARFLELARAKAVTEETLKPIASTAAPEILEIKPLIVPAIAVPEIETPGAATEGGADRE